MEELLDAMEKLTDEKFDWLENRESAYIEIGKKFDIDSETAVWYTMKIAELQLAIKELTEKLQKHVV